jgi:hypothetical protein
MIGHSAGDAKIAGLVTIFLHLIFCKRQQVNLPMNASKIRQKSAKQTALKKLIDQDLELHEKILQK